LIYHNQPTKASKEHGWFPRNKDGISSSACALEGQSIDSRVWYLSSQ
jgi:hypothetical protein